MKEEKNSMMEKVKNYPVGKEFYELKEEIGKGASGVVRLARCIPLEETVAIKIISLEESDLDQIAEETHAMSLVDSPNVMSSHVSFTSDDEFLWVVMPHMDCGSCGQILKKAFRQGIQDEATIATILRDTLKGLQYLHGAGMLHRDVKGDNIFVDGRTGTIKLGDLGRCASLYHNCDCLRYRNSFAGTFCWMAPEVFLRTPYDYECDIWSLGISAIELAQGHAPRCNCHPKEVCAMTLTCAPPSLEDEKNGRKYSKCFRDFVKSCLEKDPHRRPSAKELLGHPFIKKAKSSASVARSLLAEKKKDASTSCGKSSRLTNKVLGLVRHFGSMHTKVAPSH